MTDCCVCPVLYPHGPPREPDFPMVCNGCRRRLSADLADLPNLYALLPVVVAAAKGGEEQRVTGTREAPVPADLDVVDLLGDLRSGMVHDEFHDQYGTQPVVVTLDQWVRDWRDTRTGNERLPDPNVTALAGWLLARLDWACDQHPAVDEFAAELHRTTMACRAALRLQRIVDRLSAPCPRCDQKALKRTVDPIDGAADWIECASCHTLWSEKEYARLATVLLGEERRVAS